MSAGAIISLRILQTAWWEANILMRRLWKYFIIIIDWVYFAIIIFRKNPMSRLKCALLWEMTILNACITRRRWVVGVVDCSFNYNWPNRPTAFFRFISTQERLRLTKKRLFKRRAAITTVMGRGITRQLRSHIFPSWLPFPRLKLDELHFMASSSGFSHSFPLVNVKSKRASL